MEMVVGNIIGYFYLESALMTHPAVVECAVTGVPDEVRGQVVKLLLQKITRTKPQNR